MSTGIAFIAALLSLISLAAVVYPFRPFGKRWKALIALLLSIGVVGTFGPKPQPTPPVRQSEPTPASSQQFWVTSERLNRRTCPSESCGIVGQLFFRGAANVLEKRDGWVRITKFYDASCVDGRSEYVDVGNAECTEANGIIEGRFAEWVAEQHLSRNRPADPAKGAEGVEALIADSDDFSRYRSAFAQATQQLISNGRCSPADFREMGGWVKSTNHRNQPVYFTYCGGLRTSNRIYMNAQSGEVFR